MSKLIQRLLFCLVIPALSWSANAELVVIVNLQNPLQTITDRQLSDLYLGRTRHFQNGDIAVALEHPRDSELRKMFFNSINGMPIRQVNSYWARLQFSGEVQPPAVMASSRMVKEKISQMRYGIGYIDSSDVDQSVKVIQRLNK